MKKIFLFSLFLLFSFLSVMAQQNIVKGKVTDQSGETLPGVNVVIKGTSIGVITDLNGVYSLEVNDPSKDVFSILFYRL